MARSVQLTHRVMAYQAIVLLVAACFVDSHLTSSETKPIARLVLSPERVTTHPDRPVEFTVVGLSTGGDTVPISVSWKAGHGTVRETPEVPDHGVGRKVGDYQTSAVGIDTVVVADTSGLTDTSEVDITSDVSTVEILPAVVALRPGGTRQLAATLRDSAGRVLTGRLVQWSTSAGSTATVSDAGLVTALTTGSATITATSDGISGTALVNVVDVPVAAVTVSPGAANVVVGTSVQLSATAKDSAGNLLPDRATTWASGDTRIATVSAAGLVTGVTAGTATITATSEGVSGTASVTVTNVPVAAVTVSPSSAGIRVGAALQLTAIPRDAGGNALAGRLVTWSSGDTTIAVVSASGQVTGVSAGAATITATSEGVNGTAAVSVTNVAVAAVTVSPSAANVVVGASVQLSATAKDSAGNTLTGRATTWAVSDTRIASVSPAGLVTGVAAGTATVTATSEGVSGTAAISVSNVPVAAVTVSPSSAGVRVGAVVQLSATPKDGSGNALAGRPVTWSSSDTSIATVSASGLVAGVSAGTATITATSEGVNGIATVTVSNVPVATVTVSPSSAGVRVGAVIQLSATPKDAGGNTLAGRPVTWSSSDTGIATVSADGLVAGMSAGAATITATSEGVSGTAAVTVTNVPVATVTVSPSTATVMVGTSLQLSATPQDSAGQTLTGRATTWASSDTRVATVSADGLIAGVSAGTATITATSEGVSGTAAVTVTNVPVASVTVSPSVASLLVGEQLRLSATLKDSAGNTLTGRTVTWASSDRNVAKVSSSGRVTAVSTGNATITATSEAVSGTAAVAVIVPPVASVTISPSSATAQIGFTVQLSAVLKDAAGNTLSGRTVTWSSSDTSISTVSSSGVVTGVRLGTATVTAASEGVSGTATVTVIDPLVASVTVSPSSPGVQVGATVQLSATLKDAAGKILTGRTVTWSSSATSIATVSSSGLVAGVKAGTAVITATSEGVSGTATVTVTNVPVATVTVSPSTASVTVGATVQLSATLKDAAGNTLTGRTVTWSSSATSIATVSSSGRVTGVKAGTATITATSEGVSGTATVTVTIAPVASVAVSPSSASVAVGGTVQLSAALKDAAGNTLTGRTVTWTSSATSIATVSSSGRVTGVKAGTATITATSEGVSGKATVTVTIAPVASVAVSPSSATVAVGGTVQLSATLKDAAGNTLTGRTVTWTSSATSIATVSSGGLVTGVKAGTASITATSEGVSGTAVVTVTSSTSTAPVASVTLSPSSPSVQVGFAVQLTATLKDAAGNVLSGRTVTWASSAKSIATVSSSGLVTGVSAGKATITATSEGVSGKTTVTVTSASTGSVVLVGAGDIATSGSGDEATAQLLDQVVAASGASVTVFTAGDNAYPDGAAADFASYYDPTWGRHKTRTHPSPGNHEYNTSGASAYYAYFGSLAGPSGRGYYSYDVGNWHIVSLNSEVATSTGSAQEQWLRADLAASSKPCVLAYWHKPRFSSGSSHGSSTALAPLFQALYDFNAEVVVSGHDHDYERFAPQDANGTANQTRGIREFVVGTGGNSLNPFGTPEPNSEVRYSDTFGVIKFTLGSSGYTWEFIPVSGSFRDSGSGTCH